MTRIQELDERLKSPPDGNVRDRASAMTLLSVLRPGGPLVQRIVFTFGRHCSMEQVRDLSSIYFARLAVIPRLPSETGGDALDDDLPRPPHRALQLFESSYNSDFDEYIDTFVARASRQMYEFWGTSYGFPWRRWRDTLRGRIPLDTFKRVIHLNDYEMDHYYSAYPDASVAMVGSALRVAEESARFRAEAKDLTPDEFATAYRSFLAAIQDDL
jgi:hypothetical protein